MVWPLLRRYYAERGIDAWSRGEVPQYATSNPTIAASYAEMVLAFWRDRQRLDPANADPIVVCDLGAGSGSFAFHFLRRLTTLCQRHGIDPHAFLYVLTDQAEKNVDFWEAHERFQPFFAQGLLEVATFDVETGAALHLRRSGRVVQPGDLRQPLVVVANYLFDSISQDLFYIYKGRYAHTHVSLSADQDPTGMTALELVDHLLVDYSYHLAIEPAYPEPWLEDVLQGYLGVLEGAHLLFPANAMRALERLRALSSQGVLVLSADKGYHHLDDLEHRPPPEIARHGSSLSVMVNYHVLRSYCELMGGVALTPPALHYQIDVQCLVMAGAAGSHTETAAAYQRVVHEFGPDEFFALMQQAAGNLSAMGLEAVIAYLRLAHCDAFELIRCIPRLIELAGAGLASDERRAVREIVDAAWDGYYPLQADDTVALQFAAFLCDIGDSEWGVRYLHHASVLGSRDAETLFAVASGLEQGGLPELAAPLLLRVVELQPHHRDAHLLLGRLVDKAS